ncbi:MAG: ABC transporter ATP-binding protein [Kiritimatiellae bacterium]|nr:ABC transporter ATP-binding protein [Kiritimatiellia bacterium]
MSRKKGITMNGTTTLLEVEHLTVNFETARGTVRAVDGVNLRIRRGETVALVGESGCGKTATALALTRLLPGPPVCHTSGRVIFDGTDLLSLPRQKLREVRGREIAYGFQDPASALNPVLRVSNQVREAILAHNRTVEVRNEVRRLFEIVGLGSSESVLQSYPHMLSGGMQQRVTIAMALASRPRLLVADEPTTALDVTVQAQILDLLRSVQRSFRMAMLLITHNLGIVAQMAHTLNIMYAGQIVETGPAESVLTSPLHPYTRGLLAAIPTLDVQREELVGIPGAVPDPTRPVVGCRFFPRCNVAEEKCRQNDVKLVSCGEGRQVRCCRAI